MTLDFKCLTSINNISTAFLDHAHIDLYLSVINLLFKVNKIIYMYITNKNNITLKVCTYKHKFMNWIANLNNFDILEQ